MTTELRKELTAATERLRAAATGLQEAIKGFNPSEPRDERGRWTGGGGGGGGGGDDDAKGSKLNAIAERRSLAAERNPSYTRHAAARDAMRTAAEHWRTKNPQMAQLLDETARHHEKEAAGRNRAFSEADARQALSDKLRAGHGSAKEHSEAAASHSKTAEMFRNMSREARTKGDKKTARFYTDQARAHDKDAARHTAFATARANTR